MTVVKSKNTGRENWEKKNLKHKDITWMTAESLKLTMSLTSFQEEMKKSQNGGKFQPRQSEDREPGQWHPYGSSRETRERAEEGGGPGTQKGTCGKQGSFIHLG